MESCSQIIDEMRYDMVVKKKRNVIKGFLPILVVLYAILFTLAVGMTVPEQDVRWYHYLIEIAAYIAVIAITFFFGKKIYSKCFPAFCEYKIKKLSGNTLVCSVLFIIALFILEQRLLCELYIRNGNHIAAATDMETIPEILVLSLSSVFIAPVFEELIFRYFGLTPYESTKGKVLSLISISLLFGLCHMHSPYNALAAAISGLLYGVAFLISKNLLMPIVLHFIHNAMVSVTGILYDMGVGGITFNEAPALIFFNNYWTIGAVIVIIISGLIAWKKPFKNERAHFKIP